MIGYTPSHLTENEVILEKLNQIIDYLIKNPSYQVYAYNGDFVEGTLTYLITNITESRNINVGDVVIFENSYFGNYGNRFYVNKRDCGDRATRCFR